MWRTVFRRSDQAKRACQSRASGARGRGAPVRLAQPKSMSVHECSAGMRSTLEGFKSRCTQPASCMCASLYATRVSACIHITHLCKFSGRIAAKWVAMRADPCKQQAPTHALTTACFDESKGARRPSKACACTMTIIAVDQPGLPAQSPWNCAPA
jgi:hypothetical protein